MNSCQTRHCPTCQTSAKEKWLDARLAEVLPVQYFHVVFWMTAPNRKAILAAIRAALHGEPLSPTAYDEESFAERILRRTGVDITLCHRCGKGHLRKTDRQLVPQRGQFTLDELAFAFSHGSRKAALRSPACLCVYLSACVHAQADTRRQAEVCAYGAKSGPNTAFQTPSCASPPCQPASPGDPTQ